MSYKIIHLIVFIFSLFLFWNFHRTLGWLLNGRLGRVGHWLITSTVATGVYAVLLLTAFRIYPNFHLSALLLVGLLYMAYVSLGLWLILWLAKLLGKNSPKLHRALRLIYPVALASLFGFSLYNAYTPKVVHYQVQLDKPIKPLRIGLASDLHLGSLFGTKQLDQLAQIFDEQKVDLILLPGDIMDDDVTAYLAENMQSHLAKLRAPLGVYATLGNHDFFGQQQAIKREIEKAGITVLFDQSAVINQQVILIGRNDDLHKNRPTTAQLLANVDQRLPIILLDHRPSQIKQHAQLPLDLQVSGHTHKGQIFPANFITQLNYVLDYGYEKIGNGHFIVTSGYGFWGVPFRLGSQSEVVIIDVK